MKIKPLVTEKEIPLISCAAGSVQVRPVEDARWVFTTPQLDVDVIDKVYEYMVDEGITRIALISDTAGFGKAGKTLLEAMAGSYGINIVANQTYGPYDSDMMTQLQLIKDANPQAVICWGTSPGPAIVARNMVTLGMKDNDAATPDAIPLFCSHGIAFASFMDVAGDAANGVIFLAGKLPIVDDLPDSDPQKALLMQYKTDFDAKYGSGRVNTFGGHAYDALTIVVAALESLDEDPETISASADATKAARASIRDYIEQNVTNFSGTGGIFNISASDHNGLIKEDLVWIQIVDRKWTWFQ
jgi:branched-chain amino acid transport system substrate-binding protein